jgi:mannose-6-phosphate isomerase-like protein (cupin superfamily)
MDLVTTKRPWGSFTRFTNNEPSTVKILNVNRGEILSLQYHNHRQEFWKVLKGNPEIVIGEKTEKGKEGDEFLITPHTNHRIGAPENDVTILEISTGDFDEDDIVRIEDKYNRI